MRSMSKIWHLLRDDGIELLRLNENLSLKKFGKYFNPFWNKSPNTTDVGECIAHEFHLTDLFKGIENMTTLVGYVH
jgi:hypothetical protein